MKYTIENLKEAFLASSMTNLQDYLQVQNGTGSNIATPPCLAIIALSHKVADLRNGEIVVIESVDGGDSDKFYITRTNPMSHSAGSLVMCNIFAEHFTEINDRFTLTNKLLAMAFGSIATGVVLNLDDNTLKVVPTSVPSMRVKVQAGQGFIDYVPFELSIDTQTDLIVAPTQKRIDLVQINTEGVVSIKTGVEHGTAPVKPDPDSGCIKVGSIYLTSSITAIDTGDITDERITY